MNKWRVVEAPLCIPLLLSACAGTPFTGPVGTFQKSIDESAGIIGTYYEDLNTYERKLYLESAFLNPNQEILLTDPQGKPTPLAGNTFSADGIRARLDSLALVNLYAKRLADLAGSEAPAQFVENTQVLGGNLTKLSDTFSALKGSDPTASSYIMPVSSLAGLVGELYLEQRRDIALTKAVNEGDPVVRTILALLETDLATIIDPLRKTGEKQRLLELVDYYNKHRAKLSQTERRQAIDSINAAAEGFAKSVVFNPSSLIAGISEAHQALVKYAKSSRKPTDITELTSALEVFAARVDTAAGAIRQL